MFDADGEIRGRGKPMPIDTTYGWEWDYNPDATDPNYDYANVDTTIVNGVETLQIHLPFLIPPMPYPFPFPHPIPPPIPIIPPYPKKRRIKKKKEVVPNGS